MPGELPLSAQDRSTPSLHSRRRPRASPIISHRPPIAQVEKESDHIRNRRSIRDYVAIERMIGRTLESLRSAKSAKAQGGGATDETRDDRATLVEMFGGRRPP